MTNEQFLSVKDIIEDYNNKLYPEVTKIKNDFERDLGFVLEKVCSYYAGIQRYKISGNDDYLFNTSYEDSANLRYYVSIELFDKYDTNLEKFIKPMKKRKKKLSTKQQMMQSISGISATKVPYIQDFCSKLCDEIKFSNNFQNALCNNCSIILKYKNCLVEIIVCYELTAKIISYQKGVNVYNVNLFDLYNNFYLKEKNTDSNFSLMCKIYKALEKEIIYAGISDNYISQKYGLIENLLFNTPDNMFKGDLKDIFLKTCSYLINANFKEFKTLDENIMFDNLNYKIKVAKNLVRKIMYAYNNFDEILEKSSENDVDNFTEQSQEIEKQDIVVNNETNENTDDYQNFKDKLNKK